MTIRSLAVLLATLLIASTTAMAAIPPEVKKELGDLAKELKGVSALVKKKEVDQAKELIKKCEDRIKELAIAEDEKDRSYGTFKKALESAKNVIPVSFEREVAPILKDNCLGCHNEAQAGGMLRLDTFNRLARGGRNGVPVVPRAPARSGLCIIISIPMTCVACPRMRRSSPMRTS